MSKAFLFQKAPTRSLLFLAFIIVLFLPILSLAADTEPHGAADKSFAFSPLARTAYYQIFNLRFQEAKSTLKSLKENEPDNRIAFLLENYLDFFTILVNDDRAAYKRLARNMAPRLTRIASGNRRSPWYLYAQAEIRLQWAILRGKYNKFLSALSDIKQAYALLEQNKKEHPDFKPNLKSLGVLHAMMGSVPDEYRWSLKALSGMKGTVAQGMRELESVLSYAEHYDFIFENEARVSYAFLQLHLKNDKDAAWKTLTSGQLDPSQSPVATFVLASVAMRIGRNDEAISLLEACPRGKLYHPFPYRYYLLGIAKLNRLDTDAYLAFQTFIQRFKGESGIKEAYQKLAWYHLIQGNEKAYRKNMEYVKTKGNSRSEPDKSALRAAESGEMPDAQLTRARLLFDGGYYAKALALLQNAGTAYAGQEKDALEYQYRMGRIYHELDKPTAAIGHYQQTVDRGARKPWYYACNAALQMGVLYERENNKTSARKAYKRCLEIQPKEYAATLHARAKAGLKRLQ